MGIGVKAMNDHKLIKKNYKLGSYKKLSAN